MPLQAASRRSLPDEVFAQLTAEIVSGRYAPGSAIGSERDLSEVFAVNRHVVREAIKRLEQVGLVRATQGGRTKVLDFRESAGLDLLAIVAEHAEAAEALLPLLGSALEMRAGIGADVASLCAQRAGGDVRAELTGIAGRLAAMETGGELLTLDQLFWQRILDGAGNLAYQLAFNSLIRAVHTLHDFSVPWLEQELRRGDYRRPIALAIADGDADAAAQAAHDGLTPSEQPWPPGEAVEP
ncbi:MAG TPA: GntR family transcriptional regulator [Solirubrobacteraceae bacterium]|jgi:DNA-binding FadR family transcriptional regulator|nr:GntR family transcriptional regulator [Solirubrobacteraceae bacterium]